MGRKESNQTITMTDLLPQPKNVRGVHKAKHFTCIMSHTSFILIWYATWPSEKNCFLVCKRAEYLHASFQLIWSATGLLSEKNKMTSWPHPKGICKVKIFASMLMYASFLLIWYAIGPYYERVDFILAFLRAIFWPQRNLKKLGRGPLGDAVYQITRL